jgi:hypothetical protein
MNHFQNGRDKGARDIQNMASRSVVRVENAISPENQEKIKELQKQLAELNKSIDGQTETSKRLQLISRRNEIEKAIRNLK